MPAPTISPAVRCPAMARAECVLRREVAVALARVQKPTSRRKGLGLKVYDCYRPTRAVAAMAALGAAQATTARPSAFIPALRQSASCSRSATSPRTRRIRPASPSISRWSRAARRRRDRFDRARITAPARRRPSERAPDNSLDMGTGFDCFDAKSFTPQRRDHARAERAGATFCSPPCARAASAIISANGGTFPTARGRRHAYDFPIAPR